MATEVNALDAEYAAATGSVAVFDRGARSRLLVHGRAPSQMLNGILTGTLPTGPEEVGDGVVGGRGTYHAALTPKGRMVTDLWALMPGSEDDPGVLLDVPAAGHDGLLEHFGRFLPPRFAKVDDASSTWGSLAVVGPDAARVLADAAVPGRVEPGALDALEEGHWRGVSDAELSLMVMRTNDVWPPAWIVYGPVAAVDGLRDALASAGVEKAGAGTWATLRVEAGRPEYGAELDDRTMPPEAGLVARAIDQTKGCYTGQEVIVRIRDRGHVNRELRRLRFDDGAAVSPGAELFATDGSDKRVGEIRTVVSSPRLGGVAALAYVRRGVDHVRVGDVEVAVPSVFPDDEG